MAIEEPQYTVESKALHYEIRKYGPIVVAETRIDSDFENAGNKAFKILAGYIFGANKSKTKIEITASVNQKAISEKIEMTAPVTQTKSTSGFLVQFTMPKKRIGRVKALLVHSIKYESLSRGLISPVLEKSFNKFV